MRMPSTYGGIIKLQVALLTSSKNYTFGSEAFYYDDVSFHGVQSFNDYKLAFRFVDRHDFMDFLVFLDVLWVFLFADLTKELLEIVLDATFAFGLLNLLLVPLHKTTEMYKSARARTLAWRA